MMRLNACIFANCKTKQPTPVKSERKTLGSSWINLPPDLLHAISERLDVTDCIRLSAVCTSWASTISSYLCSLAPFCLNHSIPLLLLSAQDSETKPNCTDLISYDLTTATSYSVPISIPSLHDHRLFGSDKGWLITCDRQSRMHLIKPLTGTHVLLQSKCRVNALRKVMLYRTPDCSNGYFVVGIIQGGQGLVYAVDGSEYWTPLSFKHIVDAVVYKGKCYTISSKYIYCYGLEGSSLRCERLILIQECNYGWWWPKYLVEWRGKLLVLCINQLPFDELRNHAVSRVKLYKVNLRNHKRRWRCVTNLKGDALFISANHTYAASTSYTALTSCADNVKGNCIYYTDSMWHSAIYSSGAFAVYNLRKKTWEYRSSCPPNSEIHRQPPIWFSPR